MEQITVCLTVSKLTTTLVDETRKATSTLPMLFRGMPAELVIKVYGTNGAAYPSASLAGKTWRMVVSNVWDPLKTPLLATSDITVTGSEIHAVLEDTDTSQLASVIGTAETATLGAELYGITSGESKPSIILEFGLQVHNRRGGTGTPTQVVSDTVTATQVNALLSAGLEVQFSQDGSVWETLVPSRAQAYRWHRLRNPALQNASWSDAIPLIAGPTGQAGSVSVGTVAKGDTASVTNSGTAQAAVLDFVLPKGDQGQSASVAVGSVTTGAPGTQASVTNSGDEHDAVLDFTIPKGADGTVAFDSLTDAQKLSLKGDKGDAATVRIGGVTTLDAGEDATVGNAGTTGDAILQFAIPKGDRGEKGDKGDTGDTGPAGPACSLTVGAVTATETGTEPTASITGDAPDQVLHLTMPKGVKGDKGDNATIAIGTVATGAAGTNASVANSGTDTNAVLDFTIPKGDKGDATYIRVAWARDSRGTGFSLTPSDDRKYRAELPLSAQRDDLTAADFAGCAWLKCLGDDGKTIGAIAVADSETSVQTVTRITFPNATVTVGETGEAVVTFSGAGASGGDDDAFNGILMLRDALSGSRSGGGSPGGNAGEVEDTTLTYSEPSQTDSTQSIWP